MKLFKRFKNKEQFDKYYDEIIELYNQIYNIQNDLFKKVSKQFEYMIDSEIIIVAKKGQTFKFRFDQEIELITKFRDIRKRISDLQEILKNEYNYNFIKCNFENIYIPNIYQHEEFKIYNYETDVCPRKSISIAYIISNNFCDENIHIKIDEILKTYLLKEDKYANGVKIENE